MIFGGTYLVTNHNASAATVASQDMAKPVSLTGTWVQTSNGIPNVTMTATITQNEISIEMGLTNVSGLYWAGTFDTSPRYERQFSVTSIGDASMMDGKMLSSQSKSKNFAYNNGDLSFEFQMLGLETTVHLKRSP